MRGPAGWSEGDQVRGSLPLARNTNRRGVAERAVSTTQWDYSKNRISPAATLDVELEQEHAVIRVFQPWVGGISFGWWLIGQRGTEE